MVCLVGRGRRRRVREGLPAELEMRITVMIQIENGDNLLADILRLVGDSARVSVEPSRSPKRPMRLEDVRPAISISPADLKRVRDFQNWSGR